MIKLLRVFEMLAGSILKRTVNDDDQLPGEPFDGVERFGERLAYCFDRLSRV